MKSDWVHSEVGGDRGDGIAVYATPEGLWISGWYDHIVGIEAGLLPWEEIDTLRRKSRRRRPRLETENV